MSILVPASESSSAVGIFSVQRTAFQQLRDEDTAVRHFCSKTWLLLIILVLVGGIPSLSPCGIVVQVPMFVNIKLICVWCDFQCGSWYGDRRRGGA